jgi:hypothetical protein
MHWCYREPTLKDMLSDSVIRAVMEADGVDPRELEEVLTRISRAPGPFPQRRWWGPWTAETPFR